MYYLYDYLDLHPKADEKTISNRYYEYTKIYAEGASTYEYRKEERRNINRAVAILRDPIKVEMYNHANNIGTITLCPPELKEKISEKYLEALKEDLLASKFSTRWYNHNKEGCIISLIEEYVIPNIIGEMELLNIIESLNTVNSLEILFVKERPVHSSENVDEQRMTEITSSEKKTNDERDREEASKGAKIVFGFLIISIFIILILSNIV